jgi:hypothetical protein
MATNRPCDIFRVLSTYFYCIEWDEINRHLISPLFSYGYGVFGLDKRFCWSFGGQLAVSARFEST